MIIVFGSINMDVNMEVPAFPKPGETILSPDYEMGPGGKGANQALAAARSGVKTAIVGQVGDDGMGNRILNNLRRNEVMTSGVAINEKLSTGMAFVLRDMNGENQIIVASGANADVKAEQVPDEILRPGNILLLQMEVPRAETFAVLQRAKSRGVTTILNVAPAFHVTQNVLENLDYLIINEHEARTIVEPLGVPADQDLMIVAKALSMQGKLNCIITLGGEGVLAASVDGGAWRVKSMKLDQIVDTTGAGDCFSGTFASAIHEKFALPEALRRASVAAGLSCTKAGAQDSYPYISEIDDAMKNFPAAEMLCKI
jgi:ribokinase